MSKLIKIYEGMTFSMSTGEVLEHGEVSYWKEEDLALCGGGPSTQTTTSGFATEYKPEIKEMLADSKEPLRHRPTRSSCRLHKDWIGCSSSWDCSSWKSNSSCKQYDGYC